MSREGYGEYLCDWCDQRCLFTVVPFDHGGRRYHFCSYNCQWLWANDWNVPRLADFRNRTRRVEQREP